MSKAKDPVPYKESDDHVPDPLHQSGVVDTTGTTGDLGGRIDTISPIFQQAKADAFNAGVEAIEDPNVRTEEHVVLPDEDLDRAEAEQKVRDAAKEAQAKADQGLSPAQAEAAEAERRAPAKKASRPAAKKTAAKKATAPAAKN